MGDNPRFYDKGSDLWYGDFENYVRIEMDKYYDTVLKHEGVKNADCVLLRFDEAVPQLIFIEGKKNLPFRRKGFAGDISDIALQFMDSLHLACGSWLSDAVITFPDNFSAFFQQGMQIHFILVVKNSPKDELHLLKHALEKRLKREKLIWTFAVKAYNEELAMQENFVIRRDAT